MQSPHLDRDWLHQKYIVEQLSTYEIGRIVSRDPKRIYEKLKDFAIPTRPRGLNLKGSDCYGKRIASGEVLNPLLGRPVSSETRRILSEKASVPKPYLRGSRNGMSGRTGASNPNWKGGGCPERQRLYASGEWKAVVRQIYERDGYRCKRCDAGHTTKNKLHAHNIKGFTAYPEHRTDPENLVTLCNHCHTWVHSKLNVDREFLG